MAPTFGRVAKLDGIGFFLGDLWGGRDGLTDGCTLCRRALGLRGGLRRHGRTSFVSGIYFIVAKAIIREFYFIWHLKTKKAAEQVQQL
jgi:hypothetical protein